MRFFARRKRPIPAAPAGSGYSLLDAQLTITGDLRTAGSLRIDGRLEGSILSADSVVIGVGAAIEGDIHAREIVIGGTVTGDVHGGERVELQQTAVVTGDVQTASVLVQEGGVVNGRVLMGASPSTPAGSRGPRVHASPEPVER
jgi:cytoskeletal protein CcmA (bactofilin family)